MEPTRIIKSHPNFKHGSQCVAYGDYGEQLVREYLTKRNFTIYNAPSNVAHGIDNVMSDINLQFSALEIKTKARMNLPATGFDLAHWNIYNKISKNNNDMDVFFIFVDWKKGEMYAASLSTLKENIFELPSLPSHLILFNLKCFKTLRKLTDAEIIKLKSLENSNYTKK